MKQQTASNHQTHPIVKLDFFVRLVACPIPALIVISSRLSSDEYMPLGLWIALTLYALVWPHAAFFFARRSDNLRSGELRFLIFDAAVAGAAIALTSFQPLPTLALATGYASLLGSVGGVRLLVKGVSALLGTALVTGSLFTGLTVTSHEPVFSTVIAAVALFGFQTMMALLTYRTARGFVKSRRQIAEQADQIQSQNQALVQAREEALQAAKAKAAFLATMSHEIRTPLNGVLGMTRLLAETPLSAEQRDLLRTIQVSGNTLLTVINDILDYSRVESGRIDLEEEPMRVSEVVEEALEIVAERARDKGIELVCDVAPDVPKTIRGDVTRLRQVLTNLASNAVKFTEQGEVVVSVRQRRAETEETPAVIGFEVRDTGIGIPEDRISILFAPFSQADASTTRKYGGTGLGLAISKRLTELMGGTISVQSTVGVGTTVGFTIEGRLVSDVPVEHAGRMETAVGQRVLVVDDNDTNRRVLCAQLEAWGFEARGANGAAQAIDDLEKESRYSLAILDFHMPDMDGLSLARRIRDLPQRSDLPLILLSSSLVQANDDPDSLFTARLMKPARQSTLFDATMVALERGSATEPTGASGLETPRIANTAPMSILVVDDNEINRKVAGLLLQRFGYDADFAANGQIAVDRVVHRALSSEGKEAYDLVFMDVHMPEMDGLEATQAIRQLGAERPGVHWPRIVAMTADAMQGDREICLEAGMDEYLTKPLDFEAVKTVLEKIETRSEFAPRPVASMSSPPEEVAASVASSVRTSEGSIVVDWSRLDELKEFDTPEGNVVQGVIATFIEQAPNRLAEVRSGAAEYDGQRLRASAHGLKGAASNIGAVAVVDCAMRLEQAGKLQAFESAGRLVEDLSSALVATLAELHQSTGPGKGTV